MLKYRFYRSYTLFYFYLYIAAYLVRIWTYKNANEKAHTFSRSKNGYCVNSPLAFYETINFDLEKITRSRDQF